MTVVREFTLREPFVATTRHGTQNGYGNHGCRCHPCTDAWSAASLARNRRARAREALR